MTVVSFEGGGEALAEDDAHRRDGGDIERQRESGGGGLGDREAAQESMCMCVVGGHRCLDGNAEGRLCVSVDGLSGSVCWRRRSGV